MKDKPKYTMNNLRRELEAMTMEQKKERLEELRLELFIERGQKLPRDCFIIRRMIAMIKTSMNVKGFGYHPRKGVEYK